MRSFHSGALALVLSLGCVSKPELACGPGTVERDGFCVPEVPADAGVSDAEPDDSGTIDSGPADTGLPIGIHPITGVDDALPYDDLRPFGEIVGPRSIVALGESVHTSGGFSDAKVRLFRYLVEEHGFRAFGIESPWMQAELVGRYVETCSGNSVTVLTQGLFPVWANTAMQRLVEWMCSWNQTHPDDPVHFFGFDMQEPWFDGPALDTFLTLAIADASEAQVLTSSLSSCDGVDYTSVADYYADHPTGGTTITASMLNDCSTALDTIDAVLTSRGPELAARTSVQAVEIAKINSLCVRQWELNQYHAQLNPAGDRDLSASFEARDFGMAEVLLRLRALRYPDLKIAIWAHNAHLQEGEIWFPNMGSFLATELQDDYFTLGLVGYEVEINWPGQTQPPPPARASVEGLLHALGAPYLLIDLAFSGTDMPFFDPQWDYPLGGFPQDLDAFDALLFLDHSPPMDALAW